MKLYDYIVSTFKNKEPIFLEELEEVFPGNIRYQIGKLIKEGKLKRYLNGVYYLPYMTFLGVEGGLPFEYYLKKKYLHRNGQDIGYITGGGLSNRYGLTTQNFAVIEIRSNLATTAQRTLTIDGHRVILKKPVTEITNENVLYLQFLDLIYEYDTYNEIEGEEMLWAVKRRLEESKIDFSVLMKYMKYYPDLIYKKFVEGGFYKLMESV